MTTTPLTIVLDNDECVGSWDCMFNVFAFLKSDTRWLQAVGGPTLDATRFARLAAACGCIRPGLRKLYAYLRRLRDEEGVVHSIVMCTAASNRTGWVQFLRDVLHAFEAMHVGGQAGGDADADAGAGGAGAGAGAGSRKRKLGRVCKIDGEPGADSYVEGMARASPAVAAAARRPLYDLVLSREDLLRHHRASGAETAPWDEDSRTLFKSMACVRHSLGLGDAAPVVVVDDKCDFVVGTPYKIPVEPYRRTVCPADIAVAAGWTSEVSLRFQKFVEERAWREPLVRQTLRPVPWSLFTFQGFEDVLPLARRVVDSALSAGGGC
jgi:hypothetical protein